MKRPLGVTILGWIAVVFGALGLIASIFAILAALTLLTVGAGIAGGGGVLGGAALAGSAMVILALTIWAAVLSVVELVFGVGALQLKPWAWTLGLVWTWVSIASNVLTLVANRGGGFFTVLLGVLVAFAILYYLYTDEVRAAFGKSDQQAPSFLAGMFRGIDNLIHGSGQPAASPPGGSGGYPGPGAMPPQAPMYPPPPAVPQSPVSQPPATAQPPVTPQPPVASSGFEPPAPPAQAEPTAPEAPAPAPAPAAPAEPSAAEPPAGEPPAAEPPA